MSSDGILELHVKPLQSYYYYLLFIKSFIECHTL